MRQTDLENAIKLVYASAFMRCCNYTNAAVKYRTEEEKMTVILQEIVGSRQI